MSSLFAPSAVGGGFEHRYSKFLLLHWLSLCNRQTWWLHFSNSQLLCHQS